MIITLDGPSGTGKSTVAKRIAERLGFVFFDTGAMYRALAWKLLADQIDPQDREKIKESLPSFHYEIQTDSKGEKRYFVGGKEVTEAIRTQQITALSSQISAYPEVRQLLVQIQQKFARTSNSVFEGRDMGTVVFPKADYKFFLTADAKVRAMRRYQELLVKFPHLQGTLQIEQIQNEIEERDEKDSKRAVSPLRQAEDAILIDTSHDSIDVVVEKILSHIHQTRRFPRMHLFYRVIYTLARAFFKITFRLKIYGVEHMQPGGGILVANHTSFYDPPVLSISCPEEVHFLARKSLFDVPVLGWIIRKLNTHPIHRAAADAQTFRLILQLIAEHKKVILFPEGKRSWDGQLDSMERGFSFLVQKAECSIFPAYLQGAYEAWPRKRRFPKLFGRITCVFGSPIKWREFEGLEKKEAQGKILERTEQAILQLKQWLEAGAKGSPP